MLVDKYNECYCNVENNGVPADADAVTDAVQIIMKIIFIWY